MGTTPFSLDIYILLVYFLCGLCVANKRAVPNLYEPTSVNAEVYTLESKWCPKGQLPQRNDSVCCLPTACHTGHEIEPCSANGTEDQCVKCRLDYIQPNNVSSLNMDDATCFRYNRTLHYKCALEYEKPSRKNTGYPDYTWYCVCNTDKCYIKRHGLCNIQTICGINEQMNALTGACERCPWYAYKDTLSCQPCTINITLLRQGGSPEKLYQTSQSGPTDQPVRTYTASSLLATGPDNVTSAANVTAENIHKENVNTKSYYSMIAYIGVTLLGLTLIILLIFWLPRHWHGNYISRINSCFNKVTHNSAYQNDYGDTFLMGMPDNSDTKSSSAPLLSDGKVNSTDSNDKDDRQDNHYVNICVNCKRNREHPSGLPDKPTARIEPLLIGKADASVQPTVSTVSHDTSVQAAVSMAQHSSQEGLLNRDLADSDLTSLSYPSLHRSLSCGNMIEHNRGFSSLVTQGSVSAVMAMRVRAPAPTVEQDEVIEWQERDRDSVYDSERIQSPSVVIQLEDVNAEPDASLQTYSGINDGIVHDSICRVYSALPLQRQRPEGQSMSLSNTNLKVCAFTPFPQNAEKKQPETVKETCPKTVENEQTCQKVLTTLKEADSMYNMQNTADIWDLDKQKYNAMSLEVQEESFIITDFINERNEMLGLNLLNGDESSGNDIQANCEILNNETPSEQVQQSDDNEDGYPNNMKDAS